MSKKSMVLAALIFFFAGLLHGTAFAGTGKASAALNEAAEQGDLAKVKSLLTKNKIDLNAQDSTGMTPLMMASMGGNLDIVKFLLSKKVKLELKNNGGETALAFAVTNDNYEVAQALISAGANVDITVAGDEQDTLFMRAAANDKKTAEIILKKNKALINKTNKLGETALFSVARYGTPEDIQFLIKHGANLKLKNSKGQTALDVAKEASNADTTALLAKKIKK